MKNNDDFPISRNLVYNLSNIFSFRFDTYRMSDLHILLRRVATCEPTYAVVHSLSRELKIFKLSQEGRNAREANKKIFLRVLESLWVSLLHPNSLQV